MTTEAGGLKIKVARIFNTYGPRMHRADGRVVSNFIIQALAGEPTTLYRDGSQTRSFCFVSDLIDGLVRLMESPPSFTGPVNLGNPVEFTMRGLAELILKETGSRSKLVNMALPQDDPKQRQPDISLAKAKLGWEPRINLADGLKPTVDFFRQDRC
jgi:UDP-glucuronate decarboxylase